MNSSQPRWLSRNGATRWRCQCARRRRCRRPRPSTTGTVALGHSECDVVRGIGAPDNVSLSNNPRGDRVAVVNYSRGQRAGIYTFTAGRLTSIERAPEAGAPAARRQAEEEASRVISRSQSVSGAFRSEAPLGPDPGASDKKMYKIKHLVKSRGISKASPFLLCMGLFSIFCIGPR